MNNVGTAVSDWGMATWTAFAAGMVSLLSWVPRLLGAALILLIGWGLSSLAYAISHRLLTAAHFDQAIGRTGVSGALDKANVRTEPSKVAATLVKWAVLLVTFSVAADALGLPALSAGIGAIIGYIPNVLAAAVIVGLGLILAGFVRDLVKGAAGSAGVESSDVLGEVAYWGIVIFAALGAIGQLNIAPALVQTLYTGVIAAAALAAGLAFGLGLREQARDVMAGRTVSRQLRPGDEIQVAQVHGKVQHIGAVTTAIAQDDGSLVTLPNRELVEHHVTVSAESLANQRLRVTFAPTEPANTPSNALGGTSPSP